MRIVILRSNPVDPDPRVEKEVNSLLKDNHIIKIIAWDRNLKYKNKKGKLKFKNGEAEIIRFGIPSRFGAGFKQNFIPLCKFQINLLKWLIINKKEYDFIHACDFDTAIPAYICNKLLRKKYVYDIFDYYVDAFNVPKKLKKTIEKIDCSVINNAEATIICNEKRKEQIKNSIPKKLVVIHNSPNNNFDKITKCSQNLSNRIKLVYVGVLTDGRFIMELVNLIKNNKKYELHIGGFGKYEQAIRDIAIKNDNIIFYGRISYEKTLELESMCDIITAIYDPNIRNHYYAAPNKFYEALMLGKPIIMIKNTGMDDIVVKNDIGEVAEFNILSIEKAIDRLVKRKNEWNIISCRMKKIYSDKYAWFKMEEKLINLYRTIK